MASKQKKTEPPVSMGVYRQMIFDCGAQLLEGNCDRRDIASRLIHLADKPVEDTASPVEVRQLRTTDVSCGSCRHMSVAFNKMQPCCTEGHVMGESCGDYASRFMQFPMVLDGIDVCGWTPGCDMQAPELVAVRLASDSETHLGFLLHGLGAEVFVNYHPASRILNIHTYSNPPILVPALGRVAFGYECWWKRIQSEEDFRQITDIDTQNSWYVQAWRRCMEADRGDRETEAKV